MRSLSGSGSGKTCLLLVCLTLLLAAAVQDCDQDGYDSSVDCNDNNPHVNPGMTEGPHGDPTCADGLDNDCSGYADGGDPQCLPPQITIGQPREGAIMGSEPVAVDVTFAGGAPEELIVELNGVDITGDLTVTEGTAQGTIAALEPEMEIDELRVSLSTLEETHSFIHPPSSGGMVDDLTELRTGAGYDSAISSLYDPYASTLNDAAISHAASLGYDVEPTCPFQFSDSDVTFVGGFLRKAGDPSDVIAVVNFRVDKGAFLDYYSFLARENEPGEYEFFDDENSLVFQPVHGGGGGGGVVGYNVMYNGMMLDYITGQVVNAICPICGIAGTYRGMIQAGLWINGKIPTSNISWAWDALNLPDFTGEPGGGTTGDPHLFTLDGFTYDSQLIGEFVLLRETTSGGLEVHTRQEPVGAQNACVTFNTAVAMRLSGNAVQYTAATDEILVDGSPVTLDENETLALSGGGQITRKLGLQCVDAAGALLDVAKSGAWLNVQVRVPATLAGSLEGLLGDYDQDVSDDGRLRNGEQAPNLQAFLEDWRLQQAESLFDTPTFSAVQDCTLRPSYADIEAARQLYLSQFGVEPDEAILAAMAIDLAAGMSPAEVLGWVGNVNGSVIILDSVGALPIEARVYEGHGFPESDDVPDRVTRINDVDFRDAEDRVKAFGLPSGFAVDLRASFRIPAPGEYRIGVYCQDGFYIGLEGLDLPGGPELISVENERLWGAPESTILEGYPIATGWTINRPPARTSALISFPAEGDYAFELVHTTGSGHIFVLEVEGPPGSGLNENGLDVAPMEFFR